MTGTTTQSGANDITITGDIGLSSKISAVDMMGKKDTSTITKLTDDEFSMKDEKGKVETMNRIKDKK